MAGEDAIRSVLDGALDAVIATDGSGTIVGWNRAAEALFGWSKAEALGASSRELVIREQDRDACRAWLAALEGDQVRHHREHVLIDRHGREIEVDAAVTATRVDGCLVVTAFIHDISDRKRAERLRDAEHRVARLLAEVPGG